MNYKELRNKNVYILDFSYHLYRCYYSLKSLSIKLDSGIERPTGYIFGILNTLTTIRDYDPESIIFLAMDGYPIQRKQLMEEYSIPYKAGRAKLEFNIKQDTDSICYLASYLPNLYILENEDYEADDVMFSLAKSLDESNNVFIYTSDNDLLQTLSSNISIIKSWSESKPCILTLQDYYISPKYVKQFHQVKPYHLPFYRALTGDKSDNLQGIPRIPKQLAADIANSINNITELEFIPSSFAKTSSQLKYIKEIRNNYQKIQINHKLMRLSVIPFDIIQLEPKPLFNQYGLTKYYNYLKERDLC